MSSALVGARCSACLDACPQAALSFAPAADGRGRVVRLDAVACDGCGLCVPACPTAAIRREEPAMPLRDGDTLFIAAAALGPIAGIAATAWTPRLDAFGMRDVARWHLAGIARIVTPAADAATSAGDGAGFAQAVADLALLAASRGSAVPVLESVPLDRWIAAARAATATTGEVVSGRRAFFRRLLGGAGEAVRRAVAGCAVGLPLAAAGGKMSAHALAAVAPAFDADRCDGCDACVRLCPRGAWRRDDDGLVLRPTDCDGCGVCVDVCDRSALRLERLVAAAERRHPLETIRCIDCGHRFARRPGAATHRCRVCATPRRSDRRDRVIWVGDFDEGRTPR